MNLHRYHIVFLFLVLLTACSPKVPSEYIQPDDMEDILYDYHVAQAMAIENRQGGFDTSDESNSASVTPCFFSTAWK